MAGLLLPPGRKVVGANLIHNPYGAYDITTRRFEWLFNTWNWDGFVKPQIDYLIGDLGVNCIRMICAHWGITGGRIDPADYKRKLVQLASYLASKGVYWYPAGDSPRTDADYSTPAPQAAAAYADYLLALQQVGNCIGFDIVQEADNGFFTAQYMSDLIGAIKARGVTIPLTYSTSEAITGSGATWLNSRMASFDYLDLHIYNFTAGTDYLDYFLLNSDKDILIGETGKNTKPLAADGGGDAATQVTDLLRIFRIGLSGHPRVKGILYWCAGDQDSPASYPSDIDARQFGLYDTNTNPGTWIARSHLTRLMQRVTGGSTYRCNNR